MLGSCQVPGLNIDDLHREIPGSAVSEEALFRGYKVWIGDAPGTGPFVGILRVHAGWEVGPWFDAKWVGRQYEIIYIVRGWWNFIEGVAGKPPARTRTRSAPSVYP